MDETTTLISPEDLFERLTQGWELVVDSPRVQTYMRERYDLHQRRFKTVWDTARITTWDQWLAELWQFHRGDSHNRWLHHECQVRLVAESLLQQADDTESHRSIAWQMASSMHQSWSFLSRHGQKVEHDSKCFGATFVRACIAFERQCTQQGWLNEASLVSFLLQKPRLLEGRKILWLRQATHGAMRQRLVTHPSASASLTIRLRAPASDPTICSQETYRLAFERPERQWQAIAEWQLSLLERGTQTAHTIIIHEDPKEIAAPLIRALRTASAGAERSIALSAPIPLQHEPIAIALNALLNLLVAEPTLDQWSALLQPGFKLLSTKQAQRLRLVLRSHSPETPISHAQLQAQLQAQSGDLYQALRWWQAHAAAQHNQAISHSQASVLLKDWLNKCHWPKSFMPLSNRQHRIVLAVCDLIDQIERHDLIQNKTTLEAFCSFLSERVSEHSVAIDDSGDDAGALLSVLKPTEALDVCADMSWFADCHSELQVLKQPAHLPRSFQSLQPALDWQALFDHSHAQYFSHVITPRTPLPHPAVAQLNSQPITDSTQTHHLPRHSLSASAPQHDHELEPFADFPQLNATQQYTPAQTMGSRVLDHFIRCPFIPYAEQRLGCTSDRAVLEPSALTYGTLIHQLLHYLWSQMQPATLESAQRKLVSGQLKNLIDEAVDDRVNKSRTLPPLLVQQLKQRLLMWFRDYECTRTQPFQIAHMEHTFQVEVRGQPFNFRCDRIDQLQDGSLLVIDYKLSDKISPNQWLPDRTLTSVQLPLYQLGFAPVRAMAFAIVGFERMGWVGLGDSEQDLVSTAKIAKQELSWEQCLKNLNQRLEDLVQAWQHAHAIPQPNQARQCEQCDYRMLCHIDALRHTAAEPDPKQTPC